MSKIPLKLVLKYYWESQTIFSAHSPFIYQFMKKIIGEKERRGNTSLIESKRKEMLQSSASIPFVEYGAGTFSGKNGKERKVSDIAKNSLSGKWQCQIMHNLVEHYGLNTILEIGTSLGISTAYLAVANQNAKVITLEGNPASAEIAKRLWKDLDLSSIDVKVGEFEDTLRNAAKELETIDLAFLDGNHKKQATIDYFNLLKPRSNQKSVFIIDDIYWTKGMNEAWKAIIHDDSVAFSIDLFRMGIVFFDHSVMTKQHFKLIPYKLKPWSIGLFG